MFAGTIFSGATLLFTIQPLIARMIVPLLGGAPAVWILCSLCFQTLLLAGYGYAHFVSTRLPVRAQVILQLLLVGAVFLVMPVSVSERAISDIASRPTVGILLLLLRSIGLPFFVLSTSSPLLQRWFAELGERDPYHLYAASNAGSMLALLGYPLLMEPLMSVRGQSRVLHVAFVAYAVLVVICAQSAVRARSSLAIEATPAPPQIRTSESTLPPDPDEARDERLLRWRERLVWIALSFAPSSLLLGATEYITTDLASVPFFWVLPLALYLLSFIIAFAKRQLVPARVVSRALALVVALVAALTLAAVSGPSWLVVGAHLLLLFLASVACHRGLAERRPPVSRLTEFYLLLSIGGVLGGAFNGLLAPVLFDDLYEYPIAIGLVCLGRIVPTETPPSVARRAALYDVAYGLGLGLVTFALVRYGASRGRPLESSFGWMFGVPIVAAFLWAGRPIRYATAIGSILLAGMTHGGESGVTLWADRGFFGVLKVTREPEGKYQLLVSGRTMHGKQALEPSAAPVPLAYYHPSGPAGDVLGPLPSPDPVATPPRRVGVIGLSIGSLAAYARPGDEWTFFEMNPALVDVAKNHFSYLKNAEELRHAKISVEIGDARLLLREGPSARFDVLVLDAFSSDAVPIHLLTREALTVYRRSVDKGGLLVAQLTNSHVQLLPVFGALARDAGLVGIYRADEATAAEEKDGKDSSEWAVLTDSRASIDTLVRARAWRPLPTARDTSVWTDDYANVLGALRF